MNNGQPVSYCHTKTRNRGFVLKNNKIMCCCALSLVLVYWSKRAHVMQKDTHARSCSDRHDLIISIMTSNPMLSGSWAMKNISEVFQERVKKCMLESVRVMVPFQGAGTPTGTSTSKIVVEILVETTCLWLAQNVNHADLLWSSCASVKASKQSSSLCQDRSVPLPVVRAAIAFFLRAQNRKLWSATAMSDWQQEPSFPEGYWNSIDQSALQG